MNKQLKASPYCDTHILVWEHIPDFAIDLRRCQRCPYFDGKAMSEELEKQLQLARLDAKIEENDKAFAALLPETQHPGADPKDPDYIRVNVEGAHIYRNRREAELTAQKAHLTTKGGEQ